MRSFTDDSGRTWEATVGRESWGTFVIVFTPAGGGGARTVMLDAEAMLDAQQELEALTEQELRERLTASQPWQ